MVGDFRDSVIDDSTTVSAAMSTMDASSAGMLFVVDESGVLRGLVTERSLRHWIAAGNDMSSAVDVLIVPGPPPLTRADSADTARQRILQGDFLGIPVVDEYGVVVDVIWWEQLVEGPKALLAAHVEDRLKDVVVVVMAGGLGSRLAPYTSILPKPLMPVGEKTAIEHVMEPFVRAGCRKFVISLGHRADLIKAYFADLDAPYSVEFVKEERPLGTAGALSLMKDVLQGTFFVTNCDVIVRINPADVLEAHRLSQSEATVLAALEHHQVPYGVLEVDGAGEITSMSEKPRLDFLVSTGVYVLEPTLLELVGEAEPTDMTTLLERARDRGPAHAYPIAAASWLDIGQMDTLQAAARDMIGE